MNKEDKQKFCTKCGKELSLNSKFCMNCRAETKAAKAAIVKDNEKVLSIFLILLAIAFIFAFILVKSFNFNIDKLVLFLLFFLIILSLLVFITYIYQKLTNR